MCVRVCVCTHECVWVCTSTSLRGTVAEPSALWRAEQSGNRSWGTSVSIEAEP